MSVLQYGTTVPKTSLGGLTNRIQNNLADPVIPFTQKTLSPIHIHHFAE